MPEPKEEHIETREEQEAILRSWNFVPVPESVGPDGRPMRWERVQPDLPLPRPRLAP